MVEELVFFGIRNATDVATCLAGYAVPRRKKEFRRVNFSKGEFGPDQPITLSLDGLLLPLYKIDLQMTCSHS